MKKVSVLICAMLLASLALCQASLPSTPLGKRLGGLIEALNTKDKAKIQQFLEQNLAPEALKQRPADQRAERMMMAANDLAPISVLEVLDEDETWIVALIKPGLALRLDAENTLEKLILGIRIGDPESMKDAGKPPKEYTNWKSLDELAEQVRVDAEAPALVIGRARLTGEVEVGVAGRRAANAPENAEKSDMWLVGSIGKSMTATLIGKLIEEGLLDWDTTLAQALPDVPMLEEHKAVTIEQLLQHRSGLIQAMGFRRADVEAVAGNLTDRGAIRASYAKHVLNQPGIAKPTERFAYSNAGYSILSHIAERVGKKPFEELLAEKVFKPFGMASARIAPVGSDGMPGSKGQPSGHVMGPQGALPRIMGDKELSAMMAGAGGGVACTMEDLLNYGLIHLKGLRGEDGPLKSATFRRLHTPRYAKQGEEPYASGWSVLQGFPGGPAQWHNGSDGTMRADLALYVEKGLVVAAVLNRGGESEPSPALLACLAMAVRG